MTINILIVEDEEAFVDEITVIFGEIHAQTNLQIAKSRESATELLESNFFDLIVLDLKIPTIDGALDADPEHGHAVFARARAAARGTPILVLTGSPAEDFIPTMLGEAQQVDIWGEGQKVGTVSFLRKLSFEQLPSVVGPIIAAVHRLDDVELDRGEVELGIADERLIRIFSKRFGGARCSVTQLSGGLSGARVFRLRVTDSVGAPVHDAVAKTGLPSEISDEATRFDHYVQRLEAAATPRKLATFEFGAGKYAGVFYALADGYEYSAFDFAVGENEMTSTCLTAIEATTSRWREGSVESRRNGRDVRRRLLSDEALAEICEDYPLSWTEEFESREIQTHWVCVHGDLHGINALISETGEAVLIDYGDVGEGPASLDPITLELSAIFHPQGVELNGWPTIQQAENWGDLDSYLSDCPIKEFVSGCRAWAFRAAAGRREIALTAYAYLTRQLKYDDTDKELAIALLTGVRSFYDAT